MKSQICVLSYDRLSNFIACLVRRAMVIVQLHFGPTFWPMLLASECVKKHMLASDYPTVCKKWRFFDHEEFSVFSIR